MTASIANIEAPVAPSIWRNTAAGTKAADIAVVLMAVSLPWSTSFVAIFAVVWLLSLIPTTELRDFSETLKRPACVFPILLFALAPSARCGRRTFLGGTATGLNPVAKLLAIPILHPSF